jgi:hypothetical protein
MHAIVKKGSYLRLKDSSVIQPLQVLEFLNWFLLLQLGAGGAVDPNPISCGLAQRCPCELLKPSHFALAVGANDASVATSPDSTIACVSATIMTNFKVVFILLNSTRIKNVIKNSIVEIA